MAGPFIDFEGFLINLNSPPGAMTSTGLALGIGAGALNIAAAGFKLLEKRKELREDTDTRQRKQ